MKLPKRMTLLVSALLLSACGGGGGEVAALGPGNDSGGVGGTGITTSGRISGFGSVWVNGIKFESGDAMISIDGAPARESDLRLGMIVRVHGTVDANGTTGVADTISYEARLIGPVTSDPITDTDQELIHFQIYAFDVVAKRDLTRFESSDGTFNFDTLAAADVLKVSGFFDPVTNTIDATQIERLQNLVDTPVRLFGVISMFDAMNMTFEIAGTTVHVVSATDLTDLPNGLTDGLEVEVNGIVLMDGSVEARDVKLETDPFDGQSGEVRFEGVIRNFTSNSNFEVLGQRIDAATAQIEPSGATLADGQLVQVEGVLLASGALRADMVKLREASVDITGVIATMDIAAWMLSIELVTGAPTVSVKADGATQISDDSPLTFDQLMVGDLVRVRGPNDGALVLAHDIKRKDDDAVTLGGPLSGFDSTAGTLSILGITYSVDADTQYEFNGVQDILTDRTTFFAALTLGAIVSIEDELPADGIADEVELDLGDDDIVQIQVEGEVDDFDAATGWVTVNQITFTIDQSTVLVIDDDEAQVVDYDTFFAALQVGIDIDITDRNPVDGIADTARLEL